MPYLTPAEMQRQSAEYALRRAPNEARAMLARLRHMRIQTMGGAEVSVPSWFYDELIEWVEKMARGERT